MCTSVETVLQWSKPQKSGARELINSLQVRQPPRTQRQQGREGTDKSQQNSPSQEYLTWWTVATNINTKLNSVLSRRVCKMFLLKLTRWCVHRSILGYPATGILSRAAWQANEVQDSEERQHGCDYSHASFPVRRNTKTTWKATELADHLAIFI